MSRQWIRFIPVLLIVGIALSSCNIPVNVVVEDQPELSKEDFAATEVAKALANQLAAAATATPQPAAAPTVPPVAAQCNPTVTATTDANVRSGPSTDYSIVGNLPMGGTAVVAGTNEAHTWWYIAFAGGPGGYAWIAGSVVSASCLPPVLPVIAAPPLPVAPPPKPQVKDPTATPKGFTGPLLQIPLYLIVSPTPTPIFLQIPDFQFPWP